MPTYRAMARASNAHSGLPETRHPEGTKRPQGAQSVQATRCTDGPRRHLQASRGHTRPSDTRSTTMGLPTDTRTRASSPADRYTTQLTGRPTVASGRPAAWDDDASSRVRPAPVAQASAASVGPEQAVNKQSHSVRPDPINL